MSSPFASIPNFRDVGKSINALSSHKHLKEGLLYTCSEINDATQSDKDNLRLDYKIRTLVDTRNYKNRYVVSPSEVTEYVPENPSGFAMDSVLGMKNCALSLRMGQYSSQAWAGVPFFEKCKAFYRASAGSDVKGGQDIVAQHDLKGGSVSEMIRIIDLSTKQIGEFFNKVLADAHSYPLLISGGKLLRDPSLIYLLVLLLLDVPIEQIQTYFIAAWELTKPEPSKSKAEEDFLADIIARRNEFTETLSTHIEKKYGGIEAYLLKAGVSSDARNAIKEKLRGSMSEKQTIDVNEKQLIDM